MIKSLVAISAALVCMTGDITVQKASAQDSYCYENMSGNTVCIHKVYASNDGSNEKLVYSSVNGGSWDKTIVYCNPAHRTNYKENMYGVACFQFS